MPDRALALAVGLAELDPEVVEQFYADVLHAAIVADPDDEAGLRSQHERLLARNRTKAGVRELVAVGELNVYEIDPARFPQVLAPIVARYASVPEVAQYAAFYQARADARLALRPADFAAIAERLRASRALAPESEVAPLLDAFARELTKAR